MLERRQTHFEVQIYEGQRWLIDHVTTAREEALAVARDLLRRGGVDGVRVAKEIQNLDRGVTATRTIFQSVRKPPAPALRLGKEPVPTGPVGGAAGDLRDPLGWTAMLEASGSLAAFTSLALGGAGAAIMLWAALMG